MGIESKKDTYEATGAKKLNKEKVEIKLDNGKEVKIPLYYANYTDNARKDAFISPIIAKMKEQKDEKKKKIQKNTHSLEI